MLKQYQTIFGEGKGNCFSTCIACIFDLRVEDVPNFCGDNWTHDGEWHRQTNAWSLARGLRYFEIEFGNWIKEPFGLPDVLVIVSGPGPRGCDHSTVWRGGEMIHDPHPSGEGLITPAQVGFFVPLAPQYCFPLPVT